VPQPPAKRIFDKLVKEKQAKGYTQGEDGTSYHQADTLRLVWDVGITTDFFITAQPTHDKTVG